MANTNLTIDQILQLDAEINGFKNPQTNEVVYEGFNKQPLSILLKYELSEFSAKLSAEREKVDTLRNELISKYGEATEEGGVQISPTIQQTKGKKTEEIKNPKYAEFLNEYQKLLQKEIEFNHPEITKEDLKDAGKTKDQYNILFKLVTKD
jgi:hypothetical protein|tara:strand:- start:65 stop:517 length:453 start_codon:yes stop_codon:yes gene_type:complete